MHTFLQKLPHGKLLIGRPVNQMSQFDFREVNQYNNYD